MLAFLTVFLSLALPHRYYFSLSEIRVDTQKKTLNVSCKIFTDDLEAAIKQSFNKKIVIANTLNNQDVNDLLNRYITAHFRISINGKSLKLKYVGYENEEDATWSYFEIENFSQKGKISITNDLLYESFPDQTNIIQFYWDKINTSRKLSNPEKETSFEF